ncbi:acylphosphatase [Luteitalea sp.]|jgi:acylphosphatase|uniref:acylphosphatase n=1 Tax=Luteitalea sp. TaxID=2004800 RepID=UPI0037C7BE56
MVRATHFVVSGRVQGVGFRAYVADAARAEGLDGWVKNLPDGSVEIQAEGDLEALRRFEWQVWQGPPLSRVDEVATEDVVPAGATGFRIA